MIEEVVSMLRSFPQSGGIRDSCRYISRTIWHRRLHPATRKPPDGPDCYPRIAGVRE
ncbi:MAG: lytic transglycosylase domain-containing protein, partial [Mesorhizobium sp.]